MGTRANKTIVVIAVLLVGCFSGGCKSGAKTNEFAMPEGLGASIGSLVEVVTPGLVPVEGYGMVGGLRGTGSGECPTRVRKYLEQYILKQLPEPRMDVDAFINSSDTAVVRVYGVMPTAVTQSRNFDVMVSALAGTQTTSLEGGWLYSTELKQLGRFGMATRIMGVSEGPVYIDTLESTRPDRRVGYVPGGGIALGDYPINLVLRKPEFKLTSALRNRLNGRFGPETAKALAVSRIELRVPAKYAKQPQRFISMVKALYLAETPELTKERIKTFVKMLAVSDDDGLSEIALETIGNESLDKLSALLNSGYERVRLQAARCMLNLGSDAGLETLRTIAMDKNSALRVEALEAIAGGARRNDTAAIGRRLLGDENFEIRLASYEQLRQIDDISVTRIPVARSFYLDQISQTQYKSIYVSRSGEPRIVLFGTPILCRDNMFIQSANGEITMDSRAGQQYVSLIRKHPTRPTVVGPIRCSQELGDIIQTLCEEPVKRTEQGRVGLGVSYAEMIGLLKQMCEKGAIEAEFKAGPLPSIE
jgi:hypothetical protein